MCAVQELRKPHASPFSYFVVTLETKPRPLYQRRKKKYTLLPCGMHITPFASAMATTLRASVRPPSQVISGWMMSTHFDLISRWNPCLVYLTNVSTLSVARAAFHDLRRCISQQNSHLTHTASSDPKLANNKQPALKKYSCSPVVHITLLPLPRSAVRTSS